MKAETTFLPIFCFAPFQGRGPSFLQFLLPDMAISPFEGPGTQFIDVRSFATGSVFLPFLF